MGLRLRVQNFRALRSVDLPLSGVMCVVGANGAGKTTLLFALRFIQLCVRRGLMEAMNGLGYYQVKHRAAAASDPIEVGLSLGRYAWTLRFVVSGGGATIVSNEFLVDGQPHPTLSRIKTPKSLARALGVLDDDGASAEEPASPRPTEVEADAVSMFRAVVNGSIHYDPDLRSLRENGSKASHNVTLHSRCENTFTMLRRWNERKPERGRYDFVREALRSALPNCVDDLDFEVAGDSVFLRVWHLGDESPEAITYESNGLLSLLCTLTAVAAAERGSIVAVDEPENGLHPYAVRRMVEHVRRWCVNQEVTALFTTHSPVLLNQFRQEPERILVFEAGQTTLPTSLDQIRTREWLEGLLPGELYENLEYGAPPALSSKP